MIPHQASPIPCSLQEDCALLKRLASNPLYQAMAKALVKNKLIATTVHERFGIDALTSLQLAEVLSSAMRNPPDDCKACRRLHLAA